MAAAAPSCGSSIALKIDAPKSFRCETHCESLLKRLRARDDLCDVVLIVGNSGKRISAHRVVLIASSDYFAALLSGQMRESQEREVTLQGVNGDALETLVNYCYTGSIEMKENTIGTVFIAAKYLQFNEVIDKCCDFLQSHLQPSNCFNIFFLAIHLKLESLINKVKDFICANFEEVSTHSQFCALSFKRVSEFVASDDLAVPSEEFVFRAIMKWIEFDPENRKNHFTELLSMIRLDSISPTFLVETVEPVCISIESQKLVMAAVKSNLLCKTNPTRRRCYQSQNLPSEMLALFARNQHLAIAVYNMHSQEWKSWNTPLKFRNQFAVVLMGDELIAVGGKEIGLPLNTVISLNLRTMALTEMAPLKTARSGHSLAVLNGSIYAIGGLDENDKVLKSVERLAPGGDAWQFIAPMKSIRSSFGIAVLNDHLYVCGGLVTAKGGHCDNLFECYNTIKNVWISLANLPNGVYSHDLVAHGGYLYAIGGYSYTLGAYIGKCSGGNRYDPCTNTWKSINCSWSQFNFTKCSCLGSNIFVYNRKRVLMGRSDDTSEELDFELITNSTDLFDNCPEFTDLIGVPYEITPFENFIQKQ